MQTGTNNIRVYKDCWADNANAVEHKIILPEKMHNIRQSLWASKVKIKSYSLSKITV